MARTATVRLQMLDDVADAARLWNAFRGGSGSGSGGGAERGFLVEVHFGGDEGGASLDDRSRAAAVSRAKIAAQAAASFRDAWRRRIGTMASRHYRLAEPLLALHGVILRELGEEEALAAHLAETASAARKAGEPAEGLRAIHQARALAAAKPPLAGRRRRGRRARRSSTPRATRT